jgi:4-amino-4-deoxy-L-arabinose transferase-like glycosyltransferase
MSLTIPRPLRLLLIAFITLACCYAFAVPIYESPDELTHVGFVHHVATTGGLPVQVVGQQTAWEQEGSQPPLYYLITGLLTRFADWGDFDATRLHNPHAIIGVPGARGNINLILHDSPYPPSLSGTTLAVFIARAFSIVCGAVTVFAVWQSARLLMPHRPAVALVAAGLVAFNPQFLFISASVNNDNLVTACNSLIAWSVLLMLRDGFTPRRSLILALLLACASLSKLSGLVMLPAAGAAALYAAWRHRDLRGLLLLGVLTAGAWVSIAGWWYARNLILYGELFGTNTMLDIFGRRPAPPLELLLTEEFTGLRTSFWGLFGWFNLFTFPAFYPIMDAVMLIGAVGAVLTLTRMDADGRARFAFTLLPLAIGLISLIAWTSQTAASQGRLLFPYMVAIAGTLAIGIDTAIGLFTRREWARALPITALGMFALVNPFAIIMPMYAPPVPVEALPADAQPARVLFRDVALVGYQVEEARHAPGDEVALTLFWQPVRPSDADYSLFIRLIAPDDHILTALPTYPGYGRLRTRTWTPGAIYPDHYTLRLPLSAIGAFDLRAYIGWWKFPEGESIDPTTPDGAPIAPVMLSAGGFVSPTAARAPLPADAIPADADITFDERIRLLGHAWDGAMLRLFWEAIAAPDEDYTVLVHVIDGAYQPDGTHRLIAQGDAPPALATRWWRAGDRHMTTHVVPADSLPSGLYPLFVGWYSTHRPYRLAVRAPEAMFMDNALHLTTITVP